MNAIIKYPPCFFQKPVHASLPSFFLAGTIDMGHSEDWQAYTIDILSANASVIYNPRRENWDSSWTQEIDSPDFNVQVNWELDHIEKADYVLMYFAPQSQSPITLLELGIVAAKYPEKLLVACPDGFWRKGNVDIVCNRYGVRTYETLDVMLQNAKTLGNNPLDYTY
jgi:Nucleoside 2-deoxyribosyltransferase like